MSEPFLVGYQLSDDVWRDITAMVYCVPKEINGVLCEWRWFVKPMSRTRFERQPDGTFEIVDESAHVAWQWLTYEPRTQMAPARRW